MGTRGKIRWDSKHRNLRAGELVRADDLALKQEWKYDRMVLWFNGCSWFKSLFKTFRKI